MREKSTWGKMKSKIGFSDLLLLLLIVTNAISLFSQVDELQLKVVFIERFTRFIKWDSTLITNPDKDEFIIGTVDKKEIYPELKSFFSDRQIKDKKVIVIIPKTEEELLRCDLLFLSKISESKLKEVLEVVSNKTILTISDERDFAETGVLITICREDDHLGFCINESAFARAGLNASYLLLEQAKIINPLETENP